MKRFLSLMLCLCLILTLTACGEKRGNNSTGSGSSSDSSAGSNSGSTDGTMENGDAETRIRMGSGNNIFGANDSSLRSQVYSAKNGSSNMAKGNSATTDANSSAFNKDLVTERYQMLTALAQDLGCSHDGILNVILSQPEIWKLSENDDINENEWNVLVQAITVAIEETDQFRIHEGAFLEKDFIKHIDTIEQKLKMIPQYEEERITTAKERIKKYMTETGVKDIDENRFEQELIYYLEKLDITEEKVRLQKHIDYFRHTMEEDGSGKKLGFIAQEMGREINTTGSKANHIEIQKLVVEMKDELEKIKEQLGNIL